MIFSLLCLGSVIYVGEVYALEDSNINHVDQRGMKDFFQLLAQYKTNPAEAVEILQSFMEEQNQDLLNFWRKASEDCSLARVILKQYSESLGNPERLTEDQMITMKMHQNGIDVSETNKQVYEEKIFQKIGGVKGVIDKQSKIFIGTNADTPIFTQLLKRFLEQYSQQ